MFWMTAQTFFIFTKCVKIITHPMFEITGCIFKKNIFAIFMYEISALTAIYQALVGTVWHHGKVCHSKMKNAHFQIKDSLYLRTAIWKHFVHGDTEIFGCFEIITLFWFFVCWLRQVWVASSRITKLTQEFDEVEGGDGACGRNEMPFLQRIFEYLSTSTERSVLTIEK